MKKSLLISLLFFITNSIKSQIVTDTLTYLRTIETNKANYIGKPFSALMSNLQLEIKYFARFADFHFDKSKETRTYFCFYYPLNADQVSLIYPCLHIEWHIPLKADESRIIWSSSKGGWILNASLFYANAIIKDISIRE